MSKKAVLNRELADENGARSVLECPCCGSRSCSVVGEIPSSRSFAGHVLDRELPGGSLTTCEVCGLRFRYPRMSKTELNALYQGTPSRQWEGSSKERRDWQSAVSIIQTKFPTSASIVDVGCAYGQFLMALPNFYSKHGVEVNKDAHPSLRERGIAVIASDYEELNCHSKQYEVVVSFDSIEHSLDPLLFLKSLVKITRRGGLVLISSGNTNSMSWRLMGAKYWYCTISEHMSFINEQWCQYAASCAGLSVESIMNYAHNAGRTKDVFRDVVFNMLYLAAPTWFSKLRSQFGSRRELETNENGASAPPPWMTARDHSLYVFKRL